MKLRTILAASAVGVLVAPSAALAQTPPVSGGTNIGGSVPSFLELIITQPAKGFAAFSKTKSYDMSFNASITATDAPTQLSIVDGDATSGSKLGHLSVGSKRLASPLEASAGVVPTSCTGKSSAFQPLDGSVDAQLKRWCDAATRATTTVKLRQKIKGKSTGSYHKLVLITASTETP
jgi:hypothetical protein